MSPETLQYLAHLKVRNLKSNVPSISETTGQFLYDRIQLSGATRILELGTAHGYSTIWMAAALSKNLHTLKTQPHSDDFQGIYTIDFSRPSFQSAIANVQEAGFENLVTHIFADALDYLPTVQSKRFDFIFLDAEKRSTEKLFRLAFPMLVRNGTMVIDDVIKFRTKMEDFYHLLSEMDISYEILQTDPDDGVMVIRKPESFSLASGDFSL